MYSLISSVSKQDIEFIAAPDYGIEKNLAALEKLLTEQNGHL